MATQPAKKEDIYIPARLNRVIVLIDLDYVWKRDDLKKLKRLQSKGLEVTEMVYEFDRNPDEVLLALLHLKTSEPKKFPPYVIILEHLDFIWDWWQLRELIQIWKMGLSVQYAADYFERDHGDIVLAIMHLARIDKIKRRKGGLF